MTISKRNNAVTMHPPWTWHSIDSSQNKNERVLIWDLGKAVDPHNDL